MCLNWIKLKKSYLNYFLKIQSVISKELKEQLKLKIINDDSGMKIFYDMMCETRKKHGLPPQPFGFFPKVYLIILSNRVLGIFYWHLRMKNISRRVHFKIGKKLLYKFGASYSQYNNLRGNHFVMWEAIKKFLAEGYDEFDFGRTEIENDGLKRFKFGWNTQELHIYTTRYSINKKTFLPASTKTRGVHNLIFNHSPIFLSKLIGNALYKHIG